MKEFLPKAWTLNAGHARGDRDNPVNSGDGFYLLDKRRDGVVVGDSIIHGAGVHGDNVHAKPEAITRTCARCGNPYEGALHGRYCGNSCKQKAYRERKQYGNAQESKELRTCARCGVQFFGALHGRYHSAACKQAAYRERKQRTVKS